jgi:hypothetical protein
MCFLACVCVRDKIFAKKLPFGLIIRSVGDEIRVNSQGNHQNSSFPSCVIVGDESCVYRLAC